ncbi:hypothetical protein N6H14_16735 [Paenibacillus sp. CC-CFT747]|nr:hypothetical protein N6H14_16735 [Paenibacillus sp. CC-CFT747]
MDRLRGWLKEGHGRKLKRLHAWNAWTVLLLAVSGILLSLEAIRGPLGIVRVWLKQAHILLGLLSVVLLALYVPLIAKHLRQLKGRSPQQWNLGIVLLMLAGWSVSGLLLWQLRHLPPEWSSAALFTHDLFTWVGVPYALYHSVSRSRWLKREEARERQAQAAGRRSRLLEAAAAAGSLRRRQRCPGSRGRATGSAAAPSCG